jgi:hypothetical protein
MIRFGSGGEFGCIGKELPTAYIQPRVPLNRIAD